jgi:hypothetical protein
MATISKAWSIGNIPTDWVSVRDFGVTGDGTTDDGAALVEAIEAASLLGITLHIPKGTYKVAANTVISVAGDINIVADEGAIIESAKSDYNGTTTDAAFQFVITCNNFSLKGPVQFTTSSSNPIAKYIKLKGCDSVYIDDENMQFNDVVYSVYCENCTGDYFLRFKLRDTRNSTGTVTIINSTDPGRSADITTYLDFANAQDSYTYNVNNFQQFLFGFYATPYSSARPFNKVITNNKYQNFWAAYSGSSEPTCSGDQVDCAELWINNGIYNNFGSCGPANADSGDTGGATVVIGGVRDVILNCIATGVTFFLEAGDPKTRGFECQRLIDNSIVTHAREVGNASFAAFSLGNHSEVECTESYQFNGTCSGFERGPLIRNCRLVHTKGVVDKPYKQYFHFVGCERMFIETLGQRGGYVLRDSSGSPQYGCIQITSGSFSIKPRFLVVSDASYKSLARHSTGSFIVYSGTDALSVLGVPTDSTPSVGTYERGDFIPRKSISASGPFGQFCVSSGSFDTLSGVTVTKNSDNSNEYTVTAGISQLYEGQYIDIAGIVTTQRIQHVDRTNNFIITDYSTTTAVTNASVSCTDPTFKDTGNIAA